MLRKFRHLFFCFIYIGTDNYEHVFFEFFFCFNHSLKVPGRKWILVNRDKINELGEFRTRPIKTHHFIHQIESRIWFTASYVSVHFSISTLSPLIGLIVEIFESGRECEGWESATEAVNV